MLMSAAAVEEVATAKSAAAASHSTSACAELA
jgi:hypothetical protein